MGSEIGQILGEVCEEEIAAGRPMLSAVAVGTSGKPGSGFLPLAVELERARVDENLDDVWTRERTAVYRAWERPLPRD
jgi:hypothetical protein